MIKHAFTANLDRLRASMRFRPRVDRRRRDALHVTPSAISQQLAKLEREAGHRLLEPQDAAFA